MKALCLFVAAVIASGCVAYNDPCQPLVDNPSERVAFISKGTEVWLDRPNARHANNAIGQQAADGFVWVYKDGEHPVDFGVINGGSIRAEGLCVTRNIIKEGPLSNGVFHEILLFQNLVSSVDLSEQQVLDLFEHSLERLYAAPAAVVSPAGTFLQVSKEVQLEADCAEAPLSRVKSLKIGGKTVQRPARPVSQVTYRVAASQFLLGGGDGYSMLAEAQGDATRTVLQAQRFGGVDSDIAAAYLKQSAFNSAVESGVKVEPRVTLTNCSVPSRPSP